LAAQSGLELRRSTNTYHTEYKPVLLSGKVGRLPVLKNTERVAREMNRRKSKKVRDRIASDSRRNYVYQPVRLTTRPDP
jgi:hypothetical protein